MINIEEYLCRGGVFGKHATYYLQQVQTFQEQVHITFVPADAGRILNTLQLMVELHSDQAPRPDGALYIEHPLAVASQVLEAMAHKDPDVVMAALLHDAVEDQMTKLVQKRITRQAREGGASEEQLALDEIAWSTQSTRVRNMVAGLTNPDFDRLLEQRGLKKRTDDAGHAIYITARNELYAEHVHEALRDPDVALIKVFDFAANALNLAAVPDETKRIRYLKKYAPVIGSMLDRLRDIANPLNMTHRKREQMCACFITAQQTMIQQLKHN